MGRMSYEEACDAGYDGPSPFEERRQANRRRRNGMLDCRDPDHTGCPSCDPEMAEEEQDDD